MTHGPRTKAYCEIRAHTVSVRDGMTALCPVSVCVSYPSKSKQKVLSQHVDHGDFEGQTTEQAHAQQVYVYRCRRRRVVHGPNKGEELRECGEEIERQRHAGH